MYTQVASKLDVVTDAKYSQAVSMEGANAVQMEATVFNIKGTSAELTISLQGSNDLQNWDTLGAFDSTFADIGYATKKLTGIANAYVRLKYEMTTGTSPQAIVGAGINTANL